mmetsp:Transcript_74484/g.125480  ORF Transcript_74484/g.125480 Transcript_74484/m.125480 type:complete len:253 (-) Transcript_74484:267-1025(-)
MVPNALGQDVQHVPGVIQDEDHKPEENGNEKSELRQGFDSPVNTERNTCGGDGSNDPDDNQRSVGNDFTGCILRNYLQTCQTCHDLHCTQTQAGAHAKHDNDDGHSVDDVADPAVDLVADHGVQARAHGHGQTLQVATEAHQHCNQAVYAPSMQTPVVQRQIDCLLGLLIVSVVASSSISIAGQVVQGLRDPVKEKSNCNPTRINHHEIRHIAELRLGIFRSQFHMTKLVVHDKEENDPNILGTDVQPSERP